MVEKSKSFQIVANIILSILSATCIIPFILLLVSSLTGEKTLLNYGYSFFTTDWSIDAYKYILTNAGQIMHGYLISFIVTIVGTVLSLTVTTLYAYPLSRKNLPGKTFFSFFLFFTMLFSGGLIPSYMMWTQLFHVKNTLFALIFPNLLMSAFYVIMMRTYFNTTIPDAVLEAARIDGAGEFKILVKIVLPISVPIITTLVLLIGLGYYNDWLNGLYYTNDERYFSLQVLLNKMLMDTQFLMSGVTTKADVNMAMKTPTTSIKMAVAMMGALPIMILYPFFQKYFVKGIVIGAVKG
jgi:putative aldouronate transport system permease protein